MHTEARDFARTDQAIAAVYAETVSAWHQRLAGALERIAGNRVGARTRTTVDTSSAAWRLLALADGLAGFVLSQPQVLSADQARDLVAQALEQELGPAKGRTQGKRR